MDKGWLPIDWKDKNLQELENKLWIKQSWDEYW